MASCLTKMGSYQITILSLQHWLDGFLTPWLESLHASQPSIDPKKTSSQGEFLSKQVPETLLKTSNVRIWGLETSGGSQRKGARWECAQVLSSEFCTK